MFMWVQLPPQVHCRIGSLEIIQKLVGRHNPVHCRIGSLEKPHSNHNLIVYVHCRIDSQKNSVETAV